MKCLKIAGFGYDLQQNTGVALVSAGSELKGNEQLDGSEDSVEGGGRPSLILNDIIDRL